MTIAQPYCSASQTSQGSSGVNISWNLPSGSDVVNIETSWAGQTWASRYSTSTTMYISGVTWGNTYSVRVMAGNYDTGDLSPWSSWATFTMYDKPAAPTAGNPTNIYASYSGMNATVSFTKGSYADHTAMQFNGSYYYTSGSSFSPVTLPQKDTYYDIYLASVNADGVYSSWVYGGALRVNSAPLASPPSNITATYSGTNATVNFTKGTNAVNTALDFNGGYQYTQYSYFSVTLPSRGVYYNISLASINEENIYSSWVSGASLYAAPLPVPGTPTNINVTYSGLTANITFTKGSSTVNTALQLWDGSYQYTTGTSFSVTLPQEQVLYFVKLAGINEESIYSEWSADVGLLAVSRPTNFAGLLYKTLSDGSMVVDTLQWKSFADKVNAFRSYKMYIEFTYFTLGNAVAGNNYMSTYYNEMLESMDPICTGLPTRQSSGNEVYKILFDNLITRLNSIA